MLFSGGTICQRKPIGFLNSTICRDCWGRRLRKNIGEIRTLLSNEQKSPNPCRIYVTSQPAGYQDQLIDLVEESLYMADFTPAQMVKFIENWDFRPPKSQERLISALMDRHQILEICRNPLMHFCDTGMQPRNWRSRNKFPPSLKEAFLQDLAFEVLSDWGRTLNVTWLREQVEQHFSLHIAQNEPQVRIKKHRDLILDRALVPPFDNLLRNRNHRRCPNLCTTVCKILAQLGLPGTSVDQLA